MPPPERAVVHHNGSGTSIGGLVDGANYYVMPVDGDSTKIQLVATPGANAIPLTSGGTSSSQTLNLRPAGPRRHVGIGNGRFPMGPASAFRKVSFTARAGVQGRTFMRQGNLTTGNSKVSQGTVSIIKAPLARLILSHHCHLEWRENALVRSGRYF
jgi:hypothetical protein